MRERQNLVVCRDSLRAEQIPSLAKNANFKADIKAMKENVRSSATAFGENYIRLSSAVTVAK